MAVLTKEQIQDINHAMMGMESPVEINGKGYNRIHIGSMKTIEGKELTNIRVLNILIVLRKYKNTQLKQYAQDLEDSYEYYMEKHMNPSN